ncbi:MAG TPA: hypothetical protein VKT49_17785 [Bryobacteraceae bacterium]|nr:hypothetical protein [Bryobacteraceae bacterium]
MVLRSTRREFLAGLSAAPFALAATASNSEPVRVIAVPAGGIQPQVVLRDGVLHLIYFLGDPQHGDVFYTRSTDFGGAFSTPVRVNSQPGSAIAIGAIRGAQIAVGRSQRVHVAWNGSDQAEPRGPLNPEAGKPGSPMLYARLDPARRAFEPQRNLMLKTFGLDGGGTIAADQHGGVLVGWHGKLPGARQGEAGREVWIARSEDDGATFAAEHPATAQLTGACGCCGMRLFAASGGTVYGLYRSATQDVHRDIYLLRSVDGGKSFSTEMLHPWNINACPMSSMAFLESGDEVLAAWETQTQVYFAPVQRGVQHAQEALISPPGENPKRKYPSLARNSRGDTLLVWIDGSGWQRGGSLGWQIFDRAGRSIAASTVTRPTATWSFPAAVARPDGGFTIIA